MTTITLHDAHVTELLNILAGEYSDYHKDLYGVRPSLSSEDTVQGLLAAIAELDKAAPAILAHEQELEALAIREFEALVAKTIEQGAGTRANAIRWLHEANGTEGDDDFLCWHFGIPYGYLKQAA